MARSSAKLTPAKTKAFVVAMMQAFANGVAAQFMEELNLDEQMAIC